MSELTPYNYDIILSLSHEKEKVVYTGISVHRF